MGVDLLRAGYKTRMRLRRDSTDETEVTWFRCQPGAKVYPGHTCFASGNWAFDRFDWNGPGEVLGAPRPFYNAKAPKLGLIGRGFCGSHYAIERGADLGNPPLPKRLNGVAKCCPAITAAIGLDIVPDARLLYPGCGGCLNMCNNWTWNVSYLDPTFGPQNWSGSMSLGAGVCAGRGPWSGRSGPLSIYPPLGCVLFQDPFSSGPWTLRCFINVGGFEQFFDLTTTGPLVCNGGSVGLLDATPRLIGSVSGF